VYFKIVAKIDFLIVSCRGPGGNPPRGASAPAVYFSFAAFSASYSGVDNSGTPPISLSHLSK